jgi:hypothetical protein
VLHVTNGDCAASVLARALEGEILPWRDVLHEGPVHAGVPLEDLSRRRAAFIASAGWGDRALVRQEFAQRDAALAGAGGHDEVVLWFEHDLYDQLQLIQLLDWFAAHPHARLRMVCQAEYLGTMTPARAAELFVARRPVSAGQLKAGSAAWAAFGSADPRAIPLEPVAELPFLAPALRRLLEELPWTRDGLSRLERQVLEALRAGPLDLEALLPRAHHNREDPVFLGDTVLGWHLERLAVDGLVEKREVLFAITRRGRDVADGKADAWASPRQPRWIGGYEVRNSRLRWDPKKGVRAIFL